MAVLSTYITLDEAVQNLHSKCPRASRPYIRKFLNYVNSLGLIAVLEHEDRELLLKKDFLKKENFLVANCLQFQEPFYELSPDNFFQAPVYYGNRTHAVVSPNEMESYEYVILQNLIFLYEKDFETSRIGTVEHCFAGIKVRTQSLAVNDYLTRVKAIICDIEKNKSSIFANSAYYMGNKSALSQFIALSIDFCKPKETPVLDIMCGSGAVSGALSGMCPVFASDAQAFCTLLASVQGKANQIHSPTEILAELEPFFQENYLYLSEKYSEQLAVENSLFHMDYSSSGNAEINGTLFNRYSEYADSVILYSSDSENRKTPGFFESVFLRKEDPLLFPYCLFTAYFSNVYVGLMQAIQIDSIRYAIDKLSDPADRQWSLGALVVTCSVLGTSFGGHFAQPKRITEKNISEVLRIRSKSILHEFSKRLQVLLEEGAKHKCEIKPVSGPWERALESFSGGDELFIYLDAPYKREEYSRYYHLLETLTIYNYPESEGKGRISSKMNKERFASEFFTHNQEKVNSLLSKIIGEVLEKNRSCAWSYSNNAAASIVEVVHRISLSYGCDVTIYQTPHSHMNHGRAIKKRQKKPVLEYVLVFHQGLTH